MLVYKYYNTDADDEDVVKTEWDQHTPGVTSPQPQRRSDLPIGRRERDREIVNHWLPENEDEEKIPKLFKGKYVFPHHEVYSDEEEGR